LSSAFLSIVKTGQKKFLSIRIGLIQGQQALVNDNSDRLERLTMGGLFE